MVLEPSGILPSWDFRTCTPSAQLAPAICYSQANILPIRSGLICILTAPHTFFSWLMSQICTIQMHACARAHSHAHMCTHAHTHTDTHIFLYYGTMPSVFPTQTWLGGHVWLVLCPPVYPQDLAAGWWHGVQLPTALQNPRTSRPGVNHVSCNRRQVSEEDRNRRTLQRRGRQKAILHNRPGVSKHENSEGT